MLGRNDMLDQQDLPKVQPGIGHLRKEQKILIMYAEWPMRVENVNVNADPVL